MKYVRQFLIILAISFAGDFLNRMFPLPIPASIYGMVIMFLCLEFKIIHVEQIKDVSSFLLEVMPIMFAPSAVGFINAIPLLKEHGFHYVFLAVTSTLIVMIVTGWTAQAIIRLQEKFRDIKNKIL